MNLENYLVGNKDMDITIHLNGNTYEFNTLDECTFNSSNLEMVHEKLPAKIALINGILETFRDQMLRDKKKMKQSESNMWMQAKNTQQDDKGKALSDKKVDMLVAGSTALEDDENKLDTLASYVRRLETFANDLRGTKVAIETILKTRII